LLAIVTLSVGKYYGVAWLESFMGIVGAIVISKWALSLIEEFSGFY
jgi:Co/Zn/Cd efflux system component